MLFLLPCNGSIVLSEAVILYLLIIVSMKCKGFLDRRFCPLKDNIVLQGSIFTSHGFLVCYSITILFAYKVLLDVMFKGFKAMLLLW